ncbi:MAG: outer rane usher protein [Candidatus Eremiobacteraeota bacterium]|nr:outer rane usher protein [Candidatus Eremiobacteraeota bacterium]
MSVSQARRAAATLVACVAILANSAGIGATEASSPTPAVAEADQRAYATIVVNGERRGERIVLVKPDGVYANLPGLRADGLVLPARFDGVNGYVNVNALAPEIAAVFDLNGPMLRLNAVSPESLARTSTVSLAPVEDAVSEALAAKSGYLNYGLRVGSAGVLGAEELTLSDGAKTFFSSGTFDAHGFHRGMTNLTWTNAIARRRTIVGEVVADSGNLGSALMVTGLTVARAPDINPDGQPYVSPTLRGTVLTPSMADVYINGQLIRTVEVAPGAVDFSNLPGATGVTDATIVLRDAFGRTQSLSTRYYGAASVLNKGTTDYSFSAGESWNALGTLKSSRDLVALGRYRLGLTRSTTVGAHAEFAGGFENLGASVDHAGSLGTWNVSLAESRDRGASGFAGSVAYTASTRNASLNAVIRAATPAYTSIGERGFSDRTTSDASVTLGTRPFRGSFTSGISYGIRHSLLGAVVRQLSLQQSVSLPGGVTMMLTAGTASTNVGSQRSFSLLLFRSSPRSSSVPTLKTSLESDGSAVRALVELERTAPPSGGTGYEATGFASGPTLSSGRVGTRSSIGNVDVDYNIARAGALTGNVGISGAVAFAGSHVHLAQPISDGFAIVNVVGGQRVKVLLDNQEAGMTDRKGILVLANVPSYAAARIRIERDDAPVNLEISNAIRRLVVASRHGAVAEFSASVVTAVIGKVVVSGIGGTVVPKFGELSLRSNGKDITSSLDGDGHFYLEDVAPGRHPAVIRYGGGECRFTVEIPRTRGIESDIGEFTCVRS